MSVDLTRVILELPPSKLEEILRTTKLISDFSGNPGTGSRVIRLPVEERATHAVKFWMEQTGSDVIPRSKLLYLVGHQAGTTGATELFDHLREELSLQKVRGKNEFLNLGGGDTYWRIGHLGPLSMYRDKEAEEAESRVRAYLDVMKPVKIRIKELSNLVNIQYSRKFAVVVAKVVQERPEYDIKIFRYGYGLNNGLVRRLTATEARDRAYEKVSKSALAPHRFALDPSLLVAPIQHLTTSPILHEIMLEITDRRAKFGKGRKYMTAGPSRITGHGPLGSDKVEDRIRLMHRIGEASTGYPAEFLPWWGGGVESTSSAPTPVREYTKRVVKITPEQPVSLLDWMKKPNEQSAEIVEPSPAPKVQVPEGCSLDEFGVLRGPDGAKIGRSPKWM